MLKIIMLLFVFETFSYADFMDSVASVIKSTLSDDDENLFDDKITTVGTVEVDTSKKTTSLLGDTLTVIKEVTGIEKSQKDHSYFDDGIMAEMAHLIKLEKGETFGLPSVFGLNKKKEQKVFGSSVLGDTILGDMKNITGNFYRGFKNTGESTELMSGMMYRSSQVYNGMFKIFDDSALNVFDEKEDRDASIFDMLEKGNSVLDIMD